jgi:hypothetical protein
LAPIYMCVTGMQLGYIHLGWTVPGLARTCVTPSNMLTRLPSRAAATCTHTQFTEEHQGQARDVRIKEVGVRSSPGGEPPVSYTHLRPSNTQTYKVVPKHYLRWRRRVGVRVGDGMKDTLGPQYVRQYIVVSINWTPCYICCCWRVHSESSSPHHSIMGGATPFISGLVPALTRR